MINNQIPVLNEYRDDKKVIILKTKKMIDQEEVAAKNARFMKHFYTQLMRYTQTKTPVDALADITKCQLPAYRFIPDRFLNNSMNLFNEKGSLPYHCLCGKNISHPFSFWSKTTNKLLILGCVCIQNAIDGEEEDFILKLKESLNNKCLHCKKFNISKSAKYKNPNGYSYCKDCRRGFNKLKCTSCTHGTFDIDNKYINKCYDCVFKNNKRVYFKTSFENKYEVKRLKANWDGKNWYSTWRNTITNNKKLIKTFQIVE
jgi:hypothetical protein